MAITIDQFALGSFHYIRYPFSFFLDSAVRLGMKKLAGGRCVRPTISIVGLFRTLRDGQWMEIRRPVLELRGIVLILSL